MDLKSWRIARKLSQDDVAASLGLKSRGQVSDIERGKETASAEVAINIDRLSGGLVPVAATRPDLHDVRVIRAEQGAPA